MRGKEYCHGFGGFSGEHGFGPGPTMDEGAVSGAPSNSSIRRQTPALAPSPASSTTSRSSSISAPSAPAAAAAGIPVSMAPANSRIMRQTPVVGGATPTSGGATPKAVVDRSGVRARSANPARDARLRMEGQNQSVAPRSAPDAAPGTGNDKAIRNLLGY
jgi:hypothetical protein